MRINFKKYQGTGNDFVMIDNRQKTFPTENVELVKKLCDRRFGIGADGLILLEDDLEFDFKMIYFNADGNQSTMCGNGGRCIVAFAKELGIIKSSTSFLAIDGPHHATINNNLISLGMIDVSEISFVNGNPFVNTGSPHLVIEVEDHKQTDVAILGKQIRESHSAEGSNVNFVSWQENTLHVRTYERGVEAETFSCGTGVTAAALVMAKSNLDEQSIAIETPGGSLNVSFSKTENGFKNIKLTGPAQFVFEGSILC